LVSSNLRVIVSPAGDNAKKMPPFGRYIENEKATVNWKPVRSKNIYGREYFNNDSPELIARAYCGALLEAIFSMPTKKSISFESAVNLACDEFHKATDSGRIGKVRTMSLVL